MDNENKNTPQNELNVDELLTKQSEQVRANVAKSKRKRFFDIDVSWIVLIILALACFGITYGMQQVSRGLSAGLVIAFVIVSIVGGLLIYNLGKIIFGAISGYKLGFLEFLGICFIFDKKMAVKFDSSYFLELRLIMKPKKNPKEAKPGLMLFGGLIFFLIAGAAIFAASFVDSLGGNIQTILRFGVAVAALVPLYEILPLKYTSRNDMYTFIHTRGAANTEAYNLYLINKLADISAEMPVSSSFDSYDNSRMTPWTLLANVQSYIYNNQFESALNEIAIMEEYDVILSDYLKCERGYAKVFLLLVNGRSTEASEFIVELEKSSKNAEDFHPTISALRSDIFVSGLIENSLDSTKDAIIEFLKCAESKGYTERCEKELSIVNKYLGRINQAHPEWKLEPLSWNKKEERDNSSSESSDDQY